MAKAFHSIVLDHAAEDVWAVIRPFDHYAWAGVDVEIRIEDGKAGDQVGAVRCFTAGGELRRQALLAHSDFERSYTYRFCDPIPFPVQDYVATIRVTPVCASGANIAWMAQAFEQARSQKAPGIVLTIQADPGFDLPETEDLDESKDKGFVGYRNFIEKLTAETERFDGQVLLIHGDTHFFKFDKPLYSPTKVLPNFSRLETFGSPLIHWVKVTVDPTSPEVFTVHPVMVRQ